MGNQERKRILCCSCSGSDIIPSEVREEVARTINEVAAEVVTVSDLCGMAARNDSGLVELVARRPLTIVACHPRAVIWLLHAAGVPDPEEGIEILNMRTQSGAAISQALVADTGVGDHTICLHSEPGSWIPWYPVIDYQRCSGCSQCASFCLFGVFTTQPCGGRPGGDRASEGKPVTPSNTVTVSNPTQCKTNCPACARICPEAAIIFPKIAEAPISGAEIDPADAAALASKIKLNVDQMLGDDVYSALAERRKKARRRLLRRQAVDQATQERERCACENTDTKQPEGELPVAPDNQKPVRT